MPSPPPSSENNAQHVSKTRGPRDLHIGCYGFFFYGNQGHLPPSKYSDDDHGGGSDISNCNVHFGGPGGVWGAKGGMMVKQIKKKT